MQCQGEEKLPPDKAAQHSNHKAAGQSFFPRESSGGRGVARLPIALTSFFLALQKHCWFWLLTSLALPGRCPDGFGMRSRASQSKRNQNPKARGSVRHLWLLGVLYTLWVWTKPFGSWSTLLLMAGPLAEGEGVKDRGEGARGWTAKPRKNSCRYLAGWRGSGVQLDSGSGSSSLVAAQEEAGRSSLSGGCLRRKLPRGSQASGC